MRRMVFEKIDNGIWISHLDLMRVFQRAFRRAGLPIKHTQGFNPHAFVSIVLPLSVGTASHCELLEFELENELEDLTAIPERMNRVLPAGIHCLQAYDGGRKVKELSCLQVQVALEYDTGIPQNAEDAVSALFSRESLLVEKKSKNGMVEQDIRPMIHSLNVVRDNAHTLLLDAVICAQNPSLNPDLLSKAICVYLPEFAPDFAKSIRMEIFDSQMTVFR